MRLAGSSRKETEELAAVYAEKERTASQERLRARQAAEDTQREAGSAIRSPQTVDWFEQQGSCREGASTVDELQNRLAAMRERLPDIERITNNGIVREAATAERQATEYQGHAARNMVAASKMREEKELRTRMAAEAPAQHAREMQQRAEYLKRARQQAAERTREYARRAQREYRYEPPSQGRPGPLHGR